MRGWVKWGMLGVVGLAVLAGGTVVFGVQRARWKMEREVAILAYPLAVADTPSLVVRGKYLFESRGCSECHGADGSGRVFIEDGNGFVAKAPNIGRGPGTVTARYDASDWERAIRHGVSPARRALFIMPSEDYNRLTDDDTAAIVAYARSLPRTPGGPSEFILPLPVRVLYGLGFVKDAAEKIDHALSPAAPVPAALTVEHGAYVANMCVGCHRRTLAGGHIPGGPPDWPPAADLTPGEGSGMAAYPDADALAAMFRSGKRPDGSTVRVMPFESLKALDDLDIRSLHLYLASLSPRKTAARSSG